MKNIMMKFAIISITAFLLIGNVSARESAETGVAAGLDLNVTAELFKDSGTLEEFEMNLNDPDKGINNLDLDENGEVDYLRVEEQIAGDTHLIVMQAVLGEEQGQDVATIAIEKEAAVYNFQIHGAPVIYGVDYYIVPRNAAPGSWRLINWIYRPAYRPYRSVFGWGIYPRRWRTRRPLTVNAYRTRTVRFAGRSNFTPSRTVRVRTVTKVKYRPRTSTLVKRKQVIRTNGNGTVIGTKGVRKNGDGKEGVKKVKTVTNAKGTKTKTKKVKRKRN